MFENPEEGTVTLYAPSYRRSCLRQYKLKVPTFGKDIIFITG